MTPPFAWITWPLIQPPSELASMAMAAAINSDTMADLARLGFGLIQAPRYRFRQDLAEGTLVEVLKDFPPPPTPLVALYPQNRQLSPRLRVFLDWIGKIFAGADL